MVKANYGNQRAGMIEARRRAEALQHGVVVFQFCRPVFRAFMDSAHIGGALNFDGYADNPHDYLQMNWIPPRWMWIDPLKDRQAEILAVDAGFKARSQVIEEEGYDAAEVDQRIAEDAARADRLGIVFAGVQSLRQDCSPIRRRTTARRPPPSQTRPVRHRASSALRPSAPRRRSPSRRSRNRDLP
jgi:capsid protein